MKHVAIFILFFALWMASLVLLSVYSGGMPKELIESSILVLLALVPALIIFGLVMLIVDLFRR